MVARGPLFRSLRRRFVVALALIALVPLAVVGLGGAILERQAIAEQSARELTGLARGLAGQLDVYFDPGLVSEVQAISAMPIVATMDPEQQGPVLEQMFYLYPQFAELTTFDPSGRRLASTHPAPVLAPDNREAFSSAADRGQLAWELAPVRADGRLSFLVFTPIRDRQRAVVGVLGALVDMDTLAAVVGRVPIGDGGWAYLVDGQGRLLVHQDPAVSRSELSVTRDLLDGGRPAGSGTLRYTRDGQVWIAGFAPVPSLGWVVLVERTEAALLAPAERAWLLAVVAVAGSAVLALVGAVYLARGLTRPLRELAHAAGALAAGNPAAPLPSTTAREVELVTLVEAFSRMREAVTAREDALRQSAAEKLALAEAEREARTEAEAAVRARDEFLSIASHELRTPLTALQGATQLLLRARSRGNLDEERTNRTLRTMEASTKRLGVMIADLLDVSRLQTGQFPLRHEPVRVAEVLEAAIGRQRQSLDGRHDLVVEGLDPGVVIQADPNRLDQVFANLLENAVKYSPDGGTVHVAFAADDAGVTISVRDEGIGLPEGTSEAIFEPFGRALNASERQVQGLGLGLYICRQIVDRHGGRICAESHGEGRGTTMWVWLPRDGTAAAAQDRAG